MVGAAPSPPRRRRLRRWRFVFTVACLVVGFGVRALAGWHGYFADDESLFWATGVQLARGDAFPLVGPPISGSPAGLPGPLFYWVCALPAFVSAHPYAQSLFYAAFAELGVLAFAAVIRRWMGWKPAALFLVVAIAAPYLVAYSDRVWAGNLFFTLCAGTIWLVSRLVVRPSRKKETIALAALAVAMPQLHLSTAHLVLLAVVVLAVFRVRPSFKWLVLGAFVGALVYVPYLVHELRTDFSNTRAILAHAAGVPARSAIAVLNLYVSFFGLGTTDLSYLFARGYWHMFNQYEFWRGDGVAAMSKVYEQAGPKLLLWASHLVSWLVQLSGLVVLVVKTARRRTLRLPALLVLIAVVDIAALYAASGKYGYVHYTTILLPIALVPMLAAFTALPRRVRGPAMATFAALFLAGGATIGAHYYAHLEGTFPDQLAIVRRIHQERAGKPFVLLPGSQWIFGNAYARLSVLLERTPWEPQPGVPPSETFVVFVRDDWDAAPRQGLEVLELRQHLVLTRVR